MAIAPEDWRVVSHAAPAFTVHMPAEPRTAFDESDPDAGTLYATVGHDRTFVVSWTRADERWLPMQAEVLRQRGCVVVDCRNEPDDWIIVVDHESGARETSRLVLADGYGFMVVGLGPPAADLWVFTAINTDLTYFVDSFRVGRGNSGALTD